MHRLQLSCDEPRTLLSVICLDCPWRKSASIPSPQNPSAQAVIYDVIRQLRAVHDADTQTEDERLVACYQAAGWLE